MAGGPVRRGDDPRRGPRGVRPAGRPGDGRPAAGRPRPGAAPAGRRRQRQDAPDAGLPLGRPPGRLGPLRLPATDVGRGQLRPVHAVERRRLARAPVQPAGRDRDGLAAAVDGRPGRGPGPDRRRAVGHRRRDRWRRGFCRRRCRPGGGRLRRRRAGRRRPRPGRVRRGRGPRPAVPPAGRPAGPQQGPQVAPRGGDERLRPVADRRPRSPVPAGAGDGAGRPAGPADRRRPARGPGRVPGPAGGRRPDGRGGRPVPADRERAGRVRRRRADRHRRPLLPGRLLHHRPQPPAGAEAGPDRAQPAAAAAERATVAAGDRGHGGPAAGAPVRGVGAGGRAGQHVPVPPRTPRAAVEPEHPAGAGAVPAAPPAVRRRRRLVRAGVGHGPAAGRARAGPEPVAGQPRPAVERRRQPPGRRARRRGRTWPCCWRPRPGGPTPSWPTRTGWSRRPTATCCRSRSTGPAAASAGSSWPCARSTPAAAAWGGRWRPWRRWPPGGPWCWSGRRRSRPTRGRRCRSRSAT